MDVRSQTDGRMVFCPACQPASQPGPPCPPEAGILIVLCISSHTCAASTHFPIEALAAGSRGCSARELPYLLPCGIRPGFSGLRSPAVCWGGVYVGIDQRGRSHNISILPWWCHQYSSSPVPITARRRHRLLLFHCFLPALELVFSYRGQPCLQERSAGGA